MTDSATPNKLFLLQQTGTNSGTWGVEANSVFSRMDLNLGGRLNKDVSGNVDITISSSEAENVYHYITGALTGNIQYILPNVGSFYWLSNHSTGAHTLTAIIASGTGIAIPQGSTVGVFTNPDTGTLTALETTTSSSTTGIFIAGTTSGTNAQTVTVSTGGYAYSTGNTFVCTIGSAPTGAWTINANSLGAVNVYKVVNGGAVPAGANDAAPGQIAYFTYDGANMQLINPAPAVGDITFGVSATPSVGKLTLNADTIGSATSGATHAGSVFASLYSHLWNNCSNPSANVVCPVTGGLGLNAAADFAANKKLTIPTGANYSVMGVGSTITQAGATAGALTAVSTGSVTGTSTSGAHALTTTELPHIPLAGNYFASASAPAGQNLSSTTTVSGGWAGGAPQTSISVTADSNGGGTHTHPNGSISASYTGNATSILHPVLGLYVYISY